MRELYKEHADKLYSFALRLTGGDRPWAEDIVQETLLRAWRSLDKLVEHGGTPRPWLCTVARRIFLDGLRSRKARPTETGLGDDIDLLPIPDQTQSVVDSIAVAEALSALSPAHREVIIEEEWLPKNLYSEPDSSCL